jgi:hypothetical protein
MSFQSNTIDAFTFNMISDKDYANFEKEGAQRRRWIENPNEPGCYISRATMPLSDLMDTYEMNAPACHRAKGPKALFDPSEGPEGQLYQAFNWAHKDMRFAGYAEHNYLAIAVMRKPADSYYELPPISEVAKALYEKYFALDELQYIVVKMVVNYETKGCLEKFILPNHPAVPHLGSLTLNELESDAILGSRIGKVVAYFVLGAFERGTRRIERIVFWRDSEGHHLRFDIGKIE